MSQVTHMNESCRTYLHRSVGVWDVTLRRPLHVFNGHTDRVTSVSFFGGGGDAHMLASGSYDKQIRLWNVTTGSASGEPLARHAGEIKSICAGPGEGGGGGGRGSGGREGQYIASTGSDKKVLLWRLDI